MEKRYDYIKIEKQMQELWECEQLYQFDRCAPGEIYSIDTPPPTVSGSLHIGHLFSYTQAEIIARFRRMQGYNVFYPFGFDDNGLPTERLVERDEGIRASAVSRSEFVERCLKTTEKYENEFKTFWKSLGFSVDWSVEYKTISPEVWKISQDLFLKLVEMNKAYVKETPVLWCCECRTSIAQAELETVDIETAFNYIRFYLNSGLDNTNTGEYLEVATTRPELLYGCVCLFVNPNDVKYKKHIGKTVTVPLYDYIVPILADAGVSVDVGTGVVMCCTFGDSTDARWYNDYDLPYRKVILPDGNISDDIPYVGGFDIINARKEIVRLLNEQGLLNKTESIIHIIAVHERCGKPVEIIPSRQWYIDILSERDRFLRAADDIKWFPHSMKNRYIAWVENLKWDWCISRQRYFGVPFPVWYCKTCNAPVYAKPEQLPVNPLETNYIGVCSCGATDFFPESAVFDTWATSSVTPQINERFGLDLTPMSMRTQAHEIIRTWTFYTIVRSLYHTGDIPWKELMICGFILAKKGEKISKSKNNNENDPEYLIATYSADVLRYWTAGARLGTDTFFSTDELSVPKRFITKLWNATRFALLHLQDIDLSCTPELLPVDKWMIARTDETTASATKLLYEYEIGSARSEIDNLFWKDFCDNYIEIIKDRLYKPDIHGAQERKSGQYALYYTLLNILKLYSIYVPHITEYIYQDFFKKHEKTRSIHIILWKNIGVIDDSILRFGDNLKNTIFEMRKYKSQRNLSMRDEMDILEIRTEQRYVEWFKKTKKDILACSCAKEIKFIY